MPLVHAGSERAQPVTPAHERARKIDPAYSRGEPVRVAFARNQAESDLIQNILLEEGIPSMARRTRGFDVPDFLAAGPRDVLVPASGHDAARDVLLQADLEPVLAAEGSGVDAPVRILVGILIAVVLVALVVWLGSEIFV